MGIEVQHNPRLDVFGAAALAVGRGKRAKEEMERRQKAAEFFAGLAAQRQGRQEDMAFRANEAGLNRDFQREGQSFDVGRDQQRFRQQQLMDDRNFDQQKQLQGLGFENQAALAEQQGQRFDQRDQLDHQRRQELEAQQFLDQHTELNPQDPQWLKRWMENENARQNLNQNPTFRPAERAGEMQRLDAERQELQRSIPRRPKQRELDMDVEIAKRVRQTEKGTFMAQPDGSIDFRPPEKPEKKEDPLVQQQAAQQAWALKSADLLQKELDYRLTLETTMVDGPKKADGTAGEKKQRYTPEEADAMVEKAFSPIRAAMVRQEAKIDQPAPQQPAPQAQPPAQVAPPAKPQEPPAQEPPAEDRPFYAPEPGNFGAEYLAKMAQEQGVAPEELFQAWGALPMVRSDADFDQLESGDEFYDDQGKKWKKP